MFNDQMNSDRRVPRNTRLLPVLATFEVSLANALRRRKRLGSAVSAARERLDCEETQEGW